MEAEVDLTPYQPVRQPLRRTVSVRGLDYQLTEWGVPLGRPLVLLHGWMDVGASWQFLVDALAGERWIIAPDWRGFGDSGWCDAGYWFPDYLADLDALLAIIAPEQPVDLVGHSMGGNVAGLYAGVRPDRIHRLALLEGFGMRSTSPEDAPERYRQWLDEQQEEQTLHTPDSYERLAQRFLQRHPHLTAERAAFIARAWARRREDGVLELRGDPRHKRKNPVLYRLEETMACWRRIKAPCLWVWGLESSILQMFENPAEWEGRKACFRDWQGVPIENAGHMIQHDQPEALAAALNDFLSPPG
ncbi:MAG: alpha/beta hydrolase [Ectothiorhodospiraceae bacterium]|nr:alpha/beta hydrolase [Ectothiorhodospiraceae bacterium]